MGKGEGDARGEETHGLVRSETHGPSPADTPRAAPFSARDEAAVDQNLCLLDREDVSGRALRRGSMSRERLCMDRPWTTDAVSLKARSLTDSRFHRTPTKNSFGGSSFGGRVIKAIHAQSDGSYRGKEEVCDFTLTAELDLGLVRRHAEALVSSDAFLTSEVLMSSSTEAETELPAPTPRASGIF